MKDLGVHDVDARAHGVGEHLPPRRLLQEPVHAPGFVGDDDAEVQRVGPMHQADGHQSAMCTVESRERGEVHVGERVAGDDDERVVEQRGGRVSDTARCA